MHAASAATAPPSCAGRMSVRAAVRRASRGWASRAHDRVAWLHTAAATAASEAASTPASSSSSSGDAEPVAAYVHLPFCKRKCSYCDFPVIAVGTQGAAGSEHWQEQMERYVELLEREIGASARLNKAPLGSVFFGGGTPSLLALPLLERALAALDRRFGLAAGAEVSIEADPGTFDAARLRSYMSLGVTRVSVGVQTFEEELLALCGRGHDAADVLRAIEAVHAAGVPSWSLDLMSGLPQLTEETWQRSLERALDASPHHVSTYDLQVEEGTPFARRYSPGEAPLPSDEAAASMYCTASHVLRGAGFEHYEVSNYALPGHRCAHNMVYWEGRPFYAAGMGAASYLQGRRFSRPKRLSAYRSWVEEFSAAAAAGGPQVAGAWLPRESADDVLLDTVMLRLRLADGLDVRALAAAHPQGADAGNIVRRALAPHVARGHVLADSGGSSSDDSGGSSGGGSGETSGGGGSGSNGGGASGGGGEATRFRLADPEGLVLSNDIISDVFAAFDITSSEQAH